jgi:hypothetical protein
MVPSLSRRVSGPVVDMLRIEIEDEAQRDILFTALLLYIADGSDLSGQESGGYRV